MKLESLVYVSATEVEISGSRVWEQTHFEKTAFKDVYCKIPYILKTLQVNRVKKKHFN